MRRAILGLSTHVIASSEIVWAFIDNFRPLCLQEGKESVIIWNSGSVLISLLLLFATTTVYEILKSDRVSFHS